MHVNSLGEVDFSPALILCSIGASVAVDFLMTYLGGGVQYYRYQLETPFALTGSHNLATATAKGNVVLLFVVSANDKQWASSQELLKKVEHLVNLSL
jgi:hypothetical protein